jgi:phage tail sheath protein FI
LRGVGFNGVPQAAFVERGIDSVNALSVDSQRYFNPFGFIAYYGSYIQNASGNWVPPSPYVTGVAVRRYRAEGYQFPPAGVKYQLADAVAVQIPINSAQQNLLNPEGCNAIRTLPGYPSTAVFIWGGRTRINTSDAQQRLYQFVNTRVILNIVYGSLRNAFDNQIFNVIDGFGIVYNQIINIGNSVLNQLYAAGALYGARPSDAFQVICDARINPPASLENGVVNAKVFVTPVPTLERIQIDLIRVAIGNMQKELNLQGVGENNQ